MYLTWACIALLSLIGLYKSDLDKKEVINISNNIAYHNVISYSFVQLMPIMLLFGVSFIKAFDSFYMSQRDGRADSIWHDQLIYTFYSFGSCIAILSLYYIKRL